MEKYKTVQRRAIEAFAFGLVSVCPILLFASVLGALRPTMKVTIYWDTPPGGTEVYTEVTEISNDGKIVKLTGKNTAGEIVTVSFNWAKLLKVVQENTE